MAYGSYAGVYWDAGWRCILPVPAQTKTPPPSGYTGDHGADEVAPEVLAEWEQTHYHDSIALRLPAGVIAIDIDHYEKTVLDKKTNTTKTVTKRGGDTLRTYEAKWGPLPPTWASTARGTETEPGLSKTLFFRVPPGRYRANLPDAIEILQRHHRYCVVWPSPNPDAGGALYRWYDPTGQVVKAVPSPHELPELPAAWIAGLAEGASAATPAAAPREHAMVLLATLSADDRSPCKETTNDLLNALDEFAGASAGSRHDAALGRVYLLIRHGALGHCGTGPALEALRLRWEELTAGEDREGEWTALCVSAAAKMVTELGSTAQVPRDPCAMWAHWELPVPGVAIPDDSDAKPLDIPLVGPPVLWSRRSLIGTEAFDPRGALDQVLAAQALERIGPILRYATDTGSWILRGPHRWELMGNDMADWALTELFDLMPSGDPDADDDSEAKKRADRRKRFGQNSGASGIASKLRAMVRAPGHPITVRMGELDADPDILWAGGLPWSLRDSFERPMLATCDTCTPHLHSAGVPPSGQGLAHPTPFWDAYTAAIWPDPEVREYALRVLAVGLTGYSDAVLPMLWGQTGTGKALDVNTSILTTRGWIQMGDIQINDEVFGPDGYPTVVTGAYDTQHNRSCYRVTMSDDRTLIADGDHLWTVRRWDRRAEKWETLTTKQLIERGITQPGGRRKYYLPDQSAIVSKPTDLPIEPYLLGVWLGDGTSSAAQLNLGNQDVDELCQLITTAGAEVVSKKWRRTSWAVHFRTGKHGDFIRTARELNVLNNKHIPPAYLTAGTEQRLSLLQGLLDTDGYIDTRQGSVEFTSIHQQLAEDVLYLVRSLGWRAQLHVGTATINGRYISQKYRVLFTPKHGDLVPFRLQRRIARITPLHPGRHSTTSIVTIEPVKSRPVRCIRVARADGLYLAGKELIPTHNTSLASLIMSLLGSYAVSADPRLLTNTDNAHASIVFALMGARWAFIDEGPREGKLATGALKRLTGGAQLTGNAMRSNPVTFRPTHTLVLTCNPEETPTFADPALRRRVRLLPCEGDAEQVAATRAALTPAIWQSEAPGVLAGLMHRSALWLSDRRVAGQLAAPDVIRYRAEEIAADQDLVAQWIDAEMEPHPEGTRASELMGIYADWLRRFNIRPPNPTTFGRKLNELGYPVIKGRDGKYRGLRRRPVGSTGPYVPPPSTSTAVTMPSVVTTTARNAGPVPAPPGSLPLPPPPQPESGSQHEPPDAPRHHAYLREQALQQIPTNPPISDDALCELCGTAPVLKPCHDHCHAHGWIRGLLCGSCNSLMGRIDNGQTPLPDTLVKRELTLERLYTWRDRCHECQPDPQLRAKAFTCRDPVMQVRREPLDSPSIAEMILEQSRTAIPGDTDTPDQTSVIDNPSPEGSRSTTRMEQSGSCEDPDAETAIHSQAQTLEGSANSFGGDSCTTQGNNGQTRLDLVAGVHSCGGLDGEPGTGSDQLLLRSCAGLHSLTRSIAPQKNDPLYDHASKYVGETGKNPQPGTDDHFGAPDQANQSVAGLTTTRNPPQPATATKIAPWTDAPLELQRVQGEAALTALRVERNQLTKIIKKAPETEAAPLAALRELLVGQIKTAERRVRQVASEIKRQEAITAAGGDLLTLPAVKTRHGVSYSVSIEQAAAYARAAMTHRANPGRLTVDIESTGYPIGHPDHAVRTVQLGNADDGAVFDAGDPVQFATASLLLAEAPELEAYSAAMEISHLSAIGMLDYDSAWRRMHDVVIKAQLHNPVGTLSSDAGLKPQAETHLPEAVTPDADKARAALFSKAGWLTDTEITTELPRAGWAQVDSRCRTMVDYAVSDVHDCAALGEGLPMPASAVYARERRVQAAVGAVSLHGLRLDGEHIERMIELHRPAAENAAAAIRAAGIDNPGSNDQVAEALIRRGVTCGDGPGQLPIGAKSGKPSVKAQVLRRLPHTEAVCSLVDDLLTFRHHNRMLTTYLGPYSLLVRYGDGRLRTTIYTLQADTGRFSAVHENLQNIPRTGGIRECIICDPGELFVDADLSGVEVAVLAALSQDPVLLELVRSGQKLHKIIAELVYGPNHTAEQYNYVKNGVFAKLYGAGIARLVDTVGCTEREIIEMVDALDRVAPGVKRWGYQMRDAVAAGMDRYELYSGRILHLPAQFPHKIVNYLVQGTAREVFVDGLLRWSETPWGMRRGALVVPVHDEILSTVPAAQALEAMTTLATCMSTELYGVRIGAEPKWPRPSDHWLGNDNPLGKAA